MGPDNFLAFIVTAGFFIMTPGIDTIFVLNKSIANGKRSGIYASLGVNSGVLIHTLLAALGFSVLIAKSALIFTIVKYVGVVYLIYLGFLQLKKKSDLSPKMDQSSIPNKRKNDYISGFFTNTLNPKVALFFLAFFPQFIASDEIENPVPFILLGFTYAIIGVAWFSIITIFASVFSQKIIANPKAGLWLNKLSGLVFIIMGVQIALT
ncbi:Threonine/homoserine/homoserine lactone efflux protein [Salegentibacter holothuriorum]|uniref:Threonine/homoserine/homoserine lactone efflux protein n=1 Tax=Salegentibacter holothuriorum TaxID=241145 RepID=A0A1T5A5W5_9FLAO|nr:LysE family translocator [Salegentibacter holothuriorum]SKB30053.1 Threonine/homoserine/homoserine lactone efflux protein [Salegentibacter holothuriorum]